MHISTASRLLALLLFSAPALLAQEAGTLRGTIRSAEGEPVASATIKVGGTDRGTVGTADGGYRIEGLNDGTYMVTASRVGFAPMTREAVIVSGKMTVVDFVLSAVEYRMGDLTVTGQRTPNHRPATIGKTAIAPFDLPQSIAVVDRTTLQKQQVLQLGEALGNVNGIYVMGTTGGTQEEIAGRGFSLGSSSTFRNGVRYNNGIMPEMSSLERLEVIKGSSAILFGNVSAGGVINLVTRKPRLDQGGEISMRVGSNGLYKPTVDLYGPLLGGRTAAYRLNASYESAGSFRDVVGSERMSINPSIRIDPGAGSSILIEGEYLKDNKTSDYGTGAIDYQIADVPRTRFLGAQWSYFKAAQKSLTVTATHPVAENWAIKGVAGFQGMENDLFGTTRPNSGTMVQSDGKWIRGVQRSQVDESYRLAQLDLTGELTTGPITHSVLLGADADRYLTKTTAYTNLARYDSVNIFDLGLYTQRNDIPDLKRRTLTEAPVSRAGIYFQDLIGIGEDLKLLAGVRWSYQESGSNVLTYANDSTSSNRSFDDAVTPRLGIVYQPLDLLALFVSYSNSFTLNSGVDIAGNPLPPSFIDQYEAGVKSDLLSGSLAVNLTAYQIVNSDLAQTTLENSAARELAGEVRSRGLELDITGRPVSGMSLIAGYSYNHTQYTRSNIYEVGSLLRYNPAHTANAGINYSFGADSPLAGLDIGTTVLYIGERVAGRSTRLTVKNDAYRLMPIDGFARVDLTAGFELERLSIRAKVSNLFDALSYYVHDDNSINPITPRTFSLSLRLPI